jgi:pyruvate/2-oxoglutarate dehydrogenase complex dihydrolipoamide acyltransferase (E2) component
MVKATLLGPSDVYVLSDGTELVKGGEPVEVDDETAAALDANATDEFGLEGYKRPGVDATDAARNKAWELGVDISSVQGTGKDGRITVDDVEAAAPEEPAEGPPIGGATSNEEKIVAEHGTALLADENDPNVEDNPQLVGKGSESPTGDNSRDIDESDPEREPVQK